MAIHSIDTKRVVAYTTGANIGVLAALTAGVAVPTDVAVQDSTGVRVSSTYGYPYILYPQEDAYHEVEPGVRVSSTYGYPYILYPQEDAYHEVEYTMR